MVRVHDPAQPPVILRFLHRAETFEPLIRRRNIWHYAEIPRPARGIGHRIEFQPAFLCRLSLAPEIETRTGESDRIIRLHHPVVRIFFDFVEHFESCQQSNILRQVPDQFQPGVHGRPAPVVGPEHDVRFRRIFPHRFFDRVQPLRIISAWEKARIRAGVDGS